MTTFRTIEVPLSPTIHLTKEEAFACCEVLAATERALVRGGRVDEAARIARIFELFEHRLVDPAPPEGQLVAASSGSNSSDSELMQ